MLKIFITGDSSNYLNPMIFSVVNICDDSIKILENSTLWKEDKYVCKFEESFQEISLRSEKESK